MLKGKRLPKAVFTDEYFLSKAQQMAALGADMITIKDMSGLIPPKRVLGSDQAVQDSTCRFRSTFIPTARRATAWLPSWPLSQQEPISWIRTYGISRAVRQLRPSS